MKFYFYVNSLNIHILNKMIRDNQYLEECDKLTVTYNRNEFSNQVMFSLSYDEYMRLLDSDKINFV